MHRGTLELFFFAIALALALVKKYRNNSSKDVIVRIREIEKNYFKL